MKIDETGAPGAKAVYLRDYHPPEFQIQSVDLHFELNEDSCLVTNFMHIQLSPSSTGVADLFLDGEQLILESLKLNGAPLKAESGAYRLMESGLTVCNVPSEFHLEVKTRIFPQKNTALTGLYKSNGIFCTQNEAQGFRRITYFLDRPDVMTVFTTTIEADRKQYPVLLSNGNLIASGESASGRHWAKWHDPFKKPSYLYALVAGDLCHIEDQFRTCSGRDVTLRIFVEHGNENRCLHAMESLKKAMKWDEDTFGREYDLDVFMIVAVGDFNAGAMENKGLNIFNSKYVLADSKLATDWDYEHIEAVIGHEYFHNWSGNRVTCRDWFQLSLKEGFTVFRDQEFSSDMGSRPVKRIDDVYNLRTRQFAEDSGPMAHPVRPDSYIEINNFYTATVYEKGAEVIRMIHRLVGPEGFRKGSDRYFELHDGQAVTIEDFVHAMEIANNVDLSQFRLWYSQAGTPTVTARFSYDSESREFKLKLHQSCPPTPECRDKKPFHIPIAFGLVDKETGQEILPTQVLELKDSEQMFTFPEIKRRPIPSLLRGFSAPIKLEANLQEEELLLLLAHDTDEFNRWEAGQRLFCLEMKKMVELYRAGKRQAQLSPGFIEALRKVLSNEELDPAFRARVLMVPAESYFHQEMPVIDVEGAHFAHESILSSLATALENDCGVQFERCSQGVSNAFNARAAGSRSLKNICLRYLTMTSKRNWIELAFHQLKNASNMTDEESALKSLAWVDHPKREEALKLFIDKWKSEPLVVNKWLNIQAITPFESTLEQVKKLSESSYFDFNNPNKVYSLIAAYSQHNPFSYHLPSGDGYRYTADCVLQLDERNPQVAARLVAAFNLWRRMDSGRQALMQAELKRIMTQPKLSKNVYEIVSKNLKA